VSRGKKTLLNLKNIYYKDESKRFNLKSFKALGGKSLGRIDFKMDHKGFHQFIEANLMPGLRGGYFYRCCNLNLNINYQEMILRIVNNGLTLSKI